MSLTERKITEILQLHWSRGKKYHAILWLVFFILNLPYQYNAPLKKYSLTFTYLKSLYSLNIASF